MPRLCWSHLKPEFANCNKSLIDQRKCVRYCYYLTNLSVTLLLSWQIWVGIIAQSSVGAIKAIHTISWDTQKEAAARINLERNLVPAEIFCFPDIFFSNKEVPDAFALFGFHQQTRFISSQFYTVQIAGYLKVCFSICYLFSIGNQTDIWQEKQNIHWWSSLLDSVLFVIEQLVKL